jgi:hypothetical protein
VCLLWLNSAQFQQARGCQYPDWHIKSSNIGSRRQRLEARALPPSTGDRFARPPANWFNHGPLTLPSSDRRLARGLRMTIGLVLKIGLGVVCFGIGAASFIGAICMVPFVSGSDAIPAMFGAFGAIFLLFAFLLLRQVRWHND